MRNDAAPTAVDHDALELLRALVEIESPSGDAAGVGRIGAVLRERLEGAGASVEAHASPLGEHLVAEVPGRNAAPLLLIGHLDTVWPVGTLAGDVPWRVEGDVVRGPGAYDMKSGLVIMVRALERIAHTRSRQPARPVRLVLVCDEELGSPHSADLVRECAAGARAALGFESPHPDGALKVGRRGSARVAIEVGGRAAHAALDPEAGVSAIDELVDQLLRVREIVADPALVSHVLCNVGTISGGGRANVIPDAARAELGLRFIDAETERAVLDSLARLTPRREGATLDVARVSGRPTWRASDGDRMLTDKIARVAAALGQHVEGRPAAGGGDTNLTGALGIPTVDGLGPRGGGAHAVHEHALLSSLGERIDLVTRLLTTL
ncbi:M20 family metallopeptidase [Gulosibacter faecalis]|uniref:M20 family metallopeptidase n=1 Tax=Gulosibacter faecalis TaxID=272240 RepID=A0ABW5UUS6_9MICO|nr:M20 family metallopeptidase [Gulosibacter faecalis]